MKPAGQADSGRRHVKGSALERRFPRTDCFFQSHMEEWRGFSSPYGDPDRFRNFRNLSREFFGAEAARESRKEMVAFGLVIMATAWPVIYMIATVVKLLGQGHV